MTEPRRYLARCLDPVHIGSGGYRLGRVDMSIIREPGTGIPKIPGTSLAGAIHAYAESAKEEDPSLPDIAFVFGEAAGDGRQGMLRLYDADIVLFPMHSDQGTVWISTAERLREWLGGTIEDLTDEDGVAVLRGLPVDMALNLGWLLLGVVDKSAFAIPGLSKLPFVKRLAMVSDKLFHHLVNDNLEVRTSVKIDQNTGAAKSGALFTYEAIPRSTVMGFELAIDGRRGNGIGSAEIHRLLECAFSGLKLLGIGGMGTRGFGRVQVLTPLEGSGL